MPQGPAADARLQLQAANDSLYNTPPVFAIYVLMLVARWLKNDIGGLAKMAELNREKAQAAVRRARRASASSIAATPGADSRSHDERHLAAAERRAGSRRSSSRPRRAAWST